jgi:subtilisin family serine protease
MNQRKFTVFLAVLLSGVFIAAGLSLAGKSADPETLAYPLYPGKKLSLAITGDPAALHKVFIGFTSTPGAPEQALVRGAGGKIKHSYWLVPAIAATIPEAAIENLMKNPRVTSIEKDIEVYAVETVPWGIERINAPKVHATENLGSAVKVAVIDSGIDCGHPDINCYGGKDFVNNDDDPYDDNGHGTHVAGTIAALKNDTGVVGVAPYAHLYPLKVLDASGNGDYSDIVAALEWCTQNSIQVTNNSYGSSSDPGNTVKDAFDNSYIFGILHVAAAGNSGNRPGSGDNVIYPARWDSLIAVAATDSNDKRAYFSSTGAAVELAAPGYNIYSTLPGGGYGTKSGTSMASPHVAGAAALVIAGNSDLSNLEVRDILSSTAVDLGTAGRDTHYGYGLVDAMAAVSAVPQSYGTLSGTVTDTGATAISGASVAAGGESATTISDGTYSLTLPVGRYDVTASADGYESVTKTAAVEEDSTTVLDFSLAAVSVSYGAIEGSVTSSDNGSTISGAAVTDGYRETFTDETGYYKLSDVPEGDYTVTASAGGYTTWEQVVTVTQNTTTTANFSLEPEPATDPTVKAKDIVWNTEGGRSGTAHLLVTVVVTDNLENLVSGAVVSLTLSGPTNQSGTGTTGSDGTVTFKYPNAPSGTYTATVTNIEASGLIFEGEYSETYLKP